MAKDFAKKFYSTKKWQRCRQSYIDNRTMIDGGLCEECREQVGYILHHKVTLDESNINNPDVSLNHNNLEWVCKDCHDKFEGHGVGRCNARPLFDFDENGQPISLREIDRTEGIPPKRF